MDPHERGFFIEETSLQPVTDRNANAGDERLKQIMEVLTRKLHEAVKEIEPTQEEWFQAIMFLTRTGRMCNEWRQEFILLSDVLSVSMLADAINNRKPSGASESTVLGPFHVDGAPERRMGENICLDGKSEDMILHGQVRDVDGNPVANAKLDVWQANDEGFYDVQQKGLQPEFNLRGVFHTGDDGRYWFRAVKPKYYAIPDDGPVGQLLRRLGRHLYRPAHLHFIISGDGFETLTTHIFDPDDPYIESDAVFGVKESLLAVFKQIDDSAKAEDLGFQSPFFDVEHDFVLARKMDVKTRSI
jgi:catechol 1,2-dioxygenase